MKLGNIEAAAGEKTYGFFKSGESHGRFPVHIPLHIVNGAQDGPTLVVHAGASGLEIEPSLILPHVVNELDPADVKGTLVMVPLMNTSGFEFARVNSVFDDKHLNRIGRGDAGGSVSEQLIDAYYQAAIAEGRRPARYPYRLAVELPSFRRRARRGRYRIVEGAGDCAWAAAGCARQRRLQFDGAGSGARRQGGGGRLYRRRTRPARLS